MCVKEHRFIATENREDSPASWTALCFTLGSHRRQTVDWLMIADRLDMLPLGSGGYVKSVTLSN
jgi:hypothetical protein